MKSTATAVFRRAARSAIVKQLFAFCLMALMAVNAAAQNPRPANLELRGRVVDQLGAVVTSAQVTLTDAQGREEKQKVDGRGEFRLASLAAGLYTLTVIAEGFAAHRDSELLVEAGPGGVARLSKGGEALTLPLTITLDVIITEEMEVSTQTNDVSVDPDSNMSAVVLKGEELEALPDDPDELLELLREMAGPAIGPGDVQVFVNGFREGGRIPPRSAIREIRIGSNLFTAEYREPGRSRIEIITRAGTSDFHGGGSFNFNDESLNARDADAPIRAPLQVRNFNGNISGPLIKNRASFFFDFQRRAEDENYNVQATVLDPTTFAQVPFATVFQTPSRNTNFSVRSDWELSKIHRLGLSYRYNTRDSKNLGGGGGGGGGFGGGGGGGGFTLPEHASLSNNEQQTLRFSLTSFMRQRMVNEMRLQLDRRRSGSQALSDRPTIQVTDAFTGGGNQGSLFSQQTNDGLELVNNFSMPYKRHTLKFGISADGTHLEDVNRSNYGGTFTFSSLDQYRNVLLGVPGVYPTQFTINRGDPQSALTLWEYAWFAQDDFRVRPNLTLSFGFRHEFQTHLDDKVNFAPRFGVAWQPRRSRTTVIRGGVGLFYDALGINTVLNTIRFDGLHQQQLIIRNPGYPNPFSGGEQQPTRPSSIRTLDPGYNAPYTAHSTLEVDRQLPRNFAVNVGYTRVRGVHLPRSRNINAPLPGTIIPPDPTRGAINQTESAANSVRNEMRISVRRQVSRTFTIIGNYTLASTKDDAGTPMNQYDARSEWARSSGDMRHRFSITGNVTLPWKMRVLSIVNFNSSRPFNITTGRDNNFDTFTNNERPSLVDPSTPGAIITRFGAFNPNPKPGEPIIPRNFGIGPSSKNVMLSLSRTFGFGQPRGRGTPPLAALPQGPGVPGDLSQLAAMQQQQAGGQPNNGRQGGPGGGQNNGGRQGGQAGGGGGGFGGGQNRGGGGGPGGGGGGFGGGGRGGPGGGGGFGGGGFGGSEYRYNFTISITTMNALNFVNLSNYVGTLTSPFFGTSNSAGPARRVQLQLRFSF